MRCTVLEYIFCTLHCVLISQRLVFLCHHIFDNLLPSSSFLFLSGNHCTVKTIFDIRSLCNFCCRAQEGFKKRIIIATMKLLSFRTDFFMLTHIKWKIGIKLTLNAASSNESKSLKDKWTHIYTKLCISLL